MRRLLAIAVLLAGLALPSSLRAQRLGMVRSFAPSPLTMGRVFTVSRPAPSPVRAVMPSPTPAGPRQMGTGIAPYGGRSIFGGFGVTRCLSDPYNFGGITCRQYFPHQQQFLSQPWFMPSYWYFPSDYPQVAEMPAPAPEPDNSLVSQVKKLSDEVEQLREEEADRAASAAPAVAPQAREEEKPLPAVLVYRDGHQNEVQNYAILGQTLYVFAGQTTKRIQLADLNLEATEKLNEERGVVFVSPNPR
jgi:hypothetical protein